MRKNILLVTADQWRGDCLSALGHPHVQTPNFDTLLADGIAFKQHYSVCVPCAPARASLLTGMYLQNHRVARNGVPLDDRHTNIARELRKAGYTPMLFGYTDTSLDPRTYSKEEVCKYGYEGIMSGFEEGVLLPGEKPEKWLSWLREKGYDIENVDDAFSTDYDKDINTKHTRASYPPTYKAEHSQTAFLTQHVTDYIDLHLKENQDSWCVHLSYLRPHPPFVAPAPYNTLVDPSTLDPLDHPQTNTNDHPYLKAAKSAIGDWPESWLQKLANSTNYQEEAQQIRATYYGLINKVDHYFGALIDHLKKIGEYENTLIILTSDHGELMGDHGLFGKRGYYRESYHIPLIIRTPNQKKSNKGLIEDSITESVDIMPTILDWLDSSIPRQCDGQSLLPFTRGNKPKKWRQEAHWEYEFYDVKSKTVESSLGLTMQDCKLNVIQSDRYMYVHFAALPPLFFDLSIDPKTNNNVINLPQYSDKVLEFSQRLLTWRMQNDERTLTGYSVSQAEIYHRFG